MEMKDFLPWQLVNGVYKIILKVLANRMCVVMETIILKSQNAFGRERNCRFVINCQ